MDERRRARHREFLMSAIAVASVVVALMYLDVRVRDGVASGLRTPPSALVHRATAETRDVALRIEMTATEHSILGVFVASAAVLAFYMGRR
jgi:hypothetical protein